VVTPDFRQLEWDEHTEDDCRQIIRLAIREDLGRGVDLTTVALIPRDACGAADLIVRRPGVFVGLRAAQLVIDEMQLDVTCQTECTDGTTVDGKTAVARLEGSARDLLTAERILLNLVGRLSGVATLTSQYVAAISGTHARVYDTRKTTPGWRRLEKYAVRCGGGSNHRTGLFDAVLIKDNHLAQAASAAAAQEKLSPADAVTKAREFLSQFFPGPDAPHIPVEIEVDTLDQLVAVLPLNPDIILLDNMSVEQLRSAVALRDTSGATSDLEASGGIHLTTIRAVAETGVERISVGALTHSAIALDVALDWVTQ
jgi:nicotinate-nucleotide pyrophosphorylase (carboxylating)